MRRFNYGIVNKQGNSTQARFCARKLAFIYFIELRFMDVVTALVVHECPQDTFHKYQTMCAHTLLE